jgi:S1-C subfamily serine protease
MKDREEITAIHAQSTRAYVTSLRTFIFVFMAGTLGFIDEAQAARRCGWIGAQVTPITEPFAVSLGMAVPHGAVFKQPEPGSPAAHAGIQAHDVVTMINGRPLKSARDFEPRIHAMAPGTTVHIRVFRNRQPMGFAVPLGSTECSPQP